MSAALDLQPDTRLDAPSRMCGQTFAAATPSGSRHGPRWHVVATYSQAERRAVAHLTQQGYQGYLPLITVTRRDRVVRSMLHRIEVALFPGYCFCRFDADTTEWLPIRYTPGVFRLITDTAGKPTPVARGVVEALEAGDASRRTPTPSDTLWRPGAPCAARYGALNGYPAAVVAVRGDTATIAVMLFGALREVKVPVASLEARGDC